MNSKLKCVLHIGAETNEKIIPFTHDTLKKCEEKQELRHQTQKKKSKFDEIVLPLEPDECGYHPHCYRYFSCSVKTPKKWIAVRCEKIIICVSVSKFNSL